MYIEKECVYKHFVKAALNFALSFLKIFGLGGKLVTILKAT